MTETEKNYIYYMTELKNKSYDAELCKNVYAGFCPDCPLYDCNRRSV